MKCIFHRSETLSNHFTPFEPAYCELADVHEPMCNMCKYHTPLSYRRQDTKERYLSENQIEMPVIQEDDEIPFK